MAISITRYVDITSGVAGANVVPSRRLTGRLFSTNPLIPPAAFLSFSGSNALNDVGNYFGFSSVEYARASFYFAWVSNNITKPKSIDFARWVNFGVAPMIYGTKTQKLLATFNNITAGTFTLNLGGVSHAIGPLDFSTDASLAAVASRVQTAINGNSGTLWSAATVSYDATRGSFQFVGGQAGACSIAVTDGVQTLAAALGWTSIFPATILAPGAAAQEPVAAVSVSAVKSNNFGAFLFQDTLTLDEAAAVSLWTKAQNVLYRYCVPVNSANAADWSAELILNGGTDLVLAPMGTEYPEMCPMIQEAAADYTARNGTSNYMFKQFPGLTPSVDNDTDADTYDGLRVNYYGITQTDGTDLAFYQRGIMCGGTADPVDENTFSNESWLKSAAAAAILNLQLALPKISANTAGRSKIMNQLLGIVTQAKFNGTISIGKPLTTTQQAAIGDFTGDPVAWRQVQNQGFWLDVTIAPYTNDATGLQEYRATYTLVYSKDDVVRLVDGTHVLI